MNKHSHIPLRVVGAILTVTLLLSACGQKGPLYMPEKKTTTPPASPSSSSSPTETTDKK